MIAPRQFKQSADFCVKDIALKINFGPALQIKPMY